MSFEEIKKNDIAEQIFDLVQGSEFDRNLDKFFDEMEA